MAFCQKCGVQNSDTAQFCIQCGTPMGAATPTYPKGGVSTSTIGQLISSLETGSKIIGGGALLAFLGFFLPIYIWGGSSQNGVNIGGLAWLQPLFALVLLGLVYIAHENDLRTKLLSAAIEVALGMVYAPNLFTIFKGGPATSSLGVGYYFLALGFTAVVVGVFVNLNELTRNLR